MSRFLSAVLLLVLGALQAAPAQVQRAHDPVHPFTIIVLSPPPAGAAGDAARVSIEQAAKTHGLPVSVVPLAVTDSTGAPVSDDVLLQGARQLGGEAVLIGRADVANSSAWQWRLLTGYSAPAWSGSLEDGVQGAADAFARADDAQAGPPVSVVITVLGIAGLQDYARVSQLLAGLPGVQSSGLASADGAAANFQLLVRGGVAAVTGALVGSAHLAPVPGGEALRFQYRP